MRYLLVLVLALTLANAQKKPKPKPQPAPDTLVLTNVNVVDTREGAVSEGMTVVVRGARILDVAKTSPRMQIKNARVIDTTGKYLIPGLWDMHVHTAFISPRWDEKIIYPLYIANGITGVRDMGGDFEVLKDRRKRIESGQLLGPHLVIAGPFLLDATADAQTVPVHTPEEARAAVDKLQKEGADFIKILSRLSRESYFAVAGQSKKDNIPFVGHVPLVVSALEASDAGQHSIEHLDGIALACSSEEDTLRKQVLDAYAKRDWPAILAAGKQAYETYDNRKASDLFLTFLKNNTWQVPTLIWARTQAGLDSPTIASDEHLKYVPAAIRESWDPRKLLAGTRPELLAGYKQDTARAPVLVKAMEQSGVQFLAGSDGPDPFVVPGFSLHDELELLVKSGFTPAEALQSATVNPAMFLEKLDTYGAVEKNYEADLVLLDADPLEDITNIRKISAVVLGGKYYSREDLDKMLAQVETLAK